MHPCMHVVTVVAMWSHARLCCIVGEPSMNISLDTDSTDEEGKISVSLIARATHYL